MQESNSIFSNISNDAPSKGFGKTFFHNSLVHFFLIGMFACNIASWGILWFFVQSHQTIVILHYNVYFGIDLVGDRWQIFAIPLAGLLFFGINVFLAKWFYDRKERIISYILLLSALIIGCSTLVASISIAMINY